MHLPERISLLLFVIAVISPMTQARAEFEIAFQLEMANAGAVVVQPLLPNMSDEGSLVLYGGEPGGTVGDGPPNGNSPLVEALLQHLSQPGTELRQALTAVRRSVVGATGGRQRPEVRDTLACDLILSGAAQTSDVAIAGESLCAGSAPDAKRVALVIGNSAYEHGFTLYNPGRDATAMSRLLTEVGFEVDTVRDLDGAAMHAVIGSFSRRSKGADVALVYFAGNGLLVDGEDWLLGVNAQPGELHGPATAVGGNRLMQSLAGAKARVLILDSCRDDGLRSTLVR